MDLLLFGLWCLSLDLAVFAFLTGIVSAKDKILRSAKEEVEKISLHIQLMCAGFIVLF